MIDVTDQTEGSTEPLQTEKDNITEQCVDALVRVMPRLVRVFKSQLREGLLTPHQMLILSEIREGVQPGELARRCAISGPATTAALDGLVDDGFCVRAHSEDDRRKVLVQITPKGREALALSRSGAIAGMWGLLNGWEDERMYRLLSMLSDLNAAAETYLNRPTP